MYMFEGKDIAYKTVSKMPVPWWKKEDDKLLETEED